MSQKESKSTQKKSKDYLQLSIKPEGLNNICFSVADDVYEKDPVIKESIETKLEPKIIRKREVEKQLNKCVNWAKYLQQKGFENETSRSGSATTIKTNR